MSSPRSAQQNDAGSQLRAMVSRRPLSGRHRLVMLYAAFWIGVLVASLCAGCGSSNPYPAGSYERGYRYWESGNPSRAIESLGSFVRQNPTDSLAAEAQYYKALSYMQLKEYPLAAVELQILRKDYPTSDRVEDAYFTEGVAYFEQVGRIERDITGALDARVQFRRFIQEYPHSPRVPEAQEYLLQITDLVVRKRMNAVKVYRQLGRHAAAGVALDDILQDEPQSSILDEVMIWRAEAAMKTDDPDMALLMYERILNEFPDSKYTKRAQSRVKKLRPTEET